MKRLLCAVLMVLGVGCIEVPEPSNNPDDTNNQNNLNNTNNDSPLVTSLTLSPQMLTLFDGVIEDVTYEAKIADGTVVPLNQLSVSSDDNMVAEFSKSDSGILSVRAMGPGKTTLYLIANDKTPEKITKTLEVTVLGYDQIELDRQTIFLTQGQIKKIPLTFSLDDKPVVDVSAMGLKVEPESSPYASFIVTDDALEVGGMEKGRASFTLTDGKVNYPFDVVVQGQATGVAFDPPELFLSGTNDLKKVRIVAFDKDGDFVESFDDGAGSFKVGTFCKTLQLDKSKFDIDLVSGIGLMYEVKAKDGASTDLVTATCEDQNNNTYTASLLVHVQQREMRTGHEHSCGFLRGGDSVRCWGLNAFGQIGFSPPATGEDFFKTPQTVPHTFADIQHMSLGRSFTCILERSGRLQCMGINGSGQLGNNSMMLSSTPVEVRQPDRVLAEQSPWRWVSAGGYHACAINEDNHLYCWGNNNAGQIGDGSTTNQLLPARIAPQYLWSRVWAGLQHTCALTVGGRGYCWGQNTHAQIGLATNAPIVSTPTPLPKYEGAPLRIRSMSLGWYHTCAVTDDSQMHCWGRNASGQLGQQLVVDGQPVNRVVLPLGDLPPNTDKPWGSVKAAGEYTCAIAQDRKLSCWGNGQFGQLGDANLPPWQVTASEFPKLGMSKATSFDLGPQHLCAISADDKPYCWGYEGHGRLGNDSAGLRVGQAHEIAADVFDLALGENSGCALSKTAERDRTSALCWGHNVAGRLGVGGAVISSPTGVVPAKSEQIQFESLSMRHGHTCGVSDLGVAYCWGANHAGQLGDDSSGANMDKAQHVASEGQGVFTQIGVGFAHTCGIRDGAALCWGSNSRGQAGTMTSELKPTPVLQNNAPWGETVEHIAVGRHATCAAVYLAGGMDQTDLYCWGGNVGKADQDVAEPTKVGTVPGLVTKLVAGFSHFCAISSILNTEEDTLYCWGNNNDGQVSATSSRYLETPTAVVIPDAKHIVDVSAGFQHTCAAIAADGNGTAAERAKIWCWGSNFHGQLGRLPLRGSRLSPEQVTVSFDGGMSPVGIKQVYAGNEHTCAKTKDDRFYCWGSTSHGQIGDGVVGHQWEPVEVKGLN